MTAWIDTRTAPVHFIPKDQVGTPREITVEVPALEAELRRAVKGEVRFDAGTRGMYASDAGNYRQVPIGVVIPREEDDVVATIAVCRKFGAPVIPRGGGTGIPGQSSNVAVMIDFSKYMRYIRELDPEKKIARVQPGIVLDTLRDAAKQHGLTFGPDPATHNRCNIGGMLGNNSCGIHSVMAGRTVDNVEELEVLLYDGTRMRVGKTSDEELERTIREGGRKGEIYAKLKALRDRYADRIRTQYPRIPRRVSGYNLDELLPENGFHVARALVGSEGTCVTILEATLKLVPDPPVRSLLVLGYPDVFVAADHVPDVLTFNPVGLEGMDNLFMEAMVKKGMHDPAMDLMPSGDGWLLCEFGGETKEQADAPAKRLMEELKKRPNPPSMKLFDNPEQEAHVWSLREEGLGATANVPGLPENHEGWEDSAVPPDKLGAYMRDIKKLMDRYGFESSLYGHFGQGCLHARFNFDLYTAEGIDQWRHFLQEASDICVSYGGSLSGEHGDGQARGELLTRMFGEELVGAFEEFKRIWDPDWKMNPGKVVAPFRVDENLRYGTHYDPPEPETHFAYPDDKYSFAEAAKRCVGAGVCRRKHGGTMCPSYMVTLEEKHCTRGRARMLFEMLQGDPVKGGWKSEEVKESLDLCLACKGCKNDCPVQVDMATYKAEFLSHYYQGRLRPRTAYTMGLIHIWARVASIAPGIVNFMTHAPGLREVAKTLAGIAPARRIPSFAPQTFKEWWSRRQPGGVQAFRCSGVQDSDSGNPEIENRKSKIENRRVVLWADTFNNHFHPNAAIAAVEVLEGAGFQVEVPMQNLCCGRPLYDWGLLDQAKGLLRKILTTLKTDIEAGTPIVVLEPSCASVFRDELTNLFPHDTDAKRLSVQVFLLSEFLQKKAPDFELPKLPRKALVHGHCHHKSLFTMKDEEAVLKRMGVEYKMPDSGCCGMAGAFGFEKGEHHDVSLKCGERVLLPEVREASKETLIITDGFSCHEQIQQCTDREALHLSQVIQMALKEGHRASAEPYPEKRYNAPAPEAVMQSRRRTAAVIYGAAVVLGGTLWAMGRARGRRGNDD